jgi:hypothetical protein
MNYRARMGRDRSTHISYWATTGFFIIQIKLLGESLMRLPGLSGPGLHLLLSVPYLMIRYSGYIRDADSRPHSQEIDTTKAWIDVGLII